MRAPEDGTIAYDTQDNPTGTKRTATYTNLSAADVAKALSVESRVMWLGRDPLAGVELTIFEVGGADPPGPSPGFCSSPLEPADTAAPSTPTLTIALSGTKDVKLDWTAATDNHYVYGYRVFKDGQPLRNLGRDARSFTDTGVAPGSHTYSVAAYDSASPRGAGATVIAQLQSGQGKPYGNLGATSAPKSITMADVTPPSEPTNLTAKVNVPATGRPTVDLAWSAATDDVGVTRYRVFRRPVATPAASFVVIGQATGTTYTDATVTASGQYEYQVQAGDAAGNFSTRAPRVAVSIVFDDVAPSTPTGVQALNWPDVHTKDVRITWDAATDNVGVSRYGIYRNGTLIAEVSAATGLNYRDDNRPAGTYEYSVDAVDSVGNRSARSAIDRVYVANDPPVAGHSLIVFPSRDFVSAEGYPAGVYEFHVVRGRKIISRSGNISPTADGLLEVNHGGQPGCWNVNTPDIRPGDVVRIVGPDGVAEQTTTADVTAGRPVQTAAGTVVVGGTAADGAGQPIPLGQLEARLVSTGANFAKNGRNSLRTPADGTLAYDAAGSTKWTVTYTGLNAADVTRALNAESLIQWLGRDALAGTELTIAENAGDVLGGPADPCTAPLEPNTPLASNTPTGTVAFGQVPSNTTAAARTVTLANSGSVPLTIKDVYLAGANFPDVFKIASNTCGATLAVGASCQVAVTFSPGSDLTDRTASLNFATDAANLTAQSVRLTGTGFNAVAPTVTAPVHALTQGDALGIAATTAASTLPVKVSWTSATADRFELEMSRAGGAFTPVTLPAASAKAATVNVPTSNGTVQFRVRGGRTAADGTVAWSAYQTGTRFTLTAVDSAQTGQIAFGGTWTNLTVAATFGGSVRWAQTTGDSAKLPKQTYSANSIVAVIANKGPNMGRMTFQLDGGATTTVDLYSPTVVKGTLVYVRTGVAAGDHEVTVRPTGNRNSASTANRVELDGVISLR